MTYDRENVHLFFDLKQFARMCHDKIAADDEQKAENLHDNFLKAYNACKVYTRHTDRFYEHQFERGMRPVCLCSRTQHCFRAGRILSELGLV